MTYSAFDTLLKDFTTIEVINAQIAGIHRSFAAHCAYTDTKIAELENEIQNTVKIGPALDPRELSTKVEPGSQRASDPAKLADANLKNIVFEQFMSYAQEFSKEIKNTFANSIEEAQVNTVNVIMDSNKRTFPKLINDI